VHAKNYYHNDSQSMTSKKKMRIGLAKLNF
jgi:hypothetical protein